MFANGFAAMVSGVVMDKNAIREEIKVSMEEERVIEVARRGQIDPASLTEDEIQLLGLAVLSDLQGSDFIPAEAVNEN